MSGRYITHSSLSDEERLEIIKKKAAQHIADVELAPANFQTNIFRTDRAAAHSTLDDKPSDEKRPGLFVKLFNVLKRGYKTLRGVSR